MRIKRDKKFANNKNDIIINLNEFSNLNFMEKNEKIRDAMKSVTGIRNSLKSKDLLNIINYIDDKKTSLLVLNKEIVVKREDNCLVISYRKGKVYLNVIFFVVVLILITVIATYAYLFRERLLYLNKDINNDGIPELNIDQDKDGIADTNVDDDFDDIPDYNINYRNSGSAVFNIKNKDKYFNPLNQDTNNDGKCDINCDVNNDGWPDINLDMDGDGIADLFIDSEYKGYATLNIDINGDRVCDINCDNDGDNKCDVNCLDFEVIKYIDIKNNGAGVNINTALPTLILSGNEIECKNLFPTDQPQENVLKECKATFTIQNTSNISAAYNLKLEIDENSFISSNLKYKLISNNGISNIPNYVTVPKQSKIVLKNIKLNAKTTHEYHASFIIEGTGNSQNYDAGKNLKLKFVIS